MPQFRDQSLVPTEAVRLAALGILAEGERRYGELAVEVRNFISRLLGPSLDVLGTSIELLRYEGLIEPMGPRAGPGQSLTADTVVRLSAAGRSELGLLLQSRVHLPMTDLSRLVVALKLRFLHLLDEAGRRRQIEMLGETMESELARLRDLRAQRPLADDALGDWLDHEIAQTEARAAWYRGRLEEPPAKRA